MFKEKVVSMMKRRCADEKFIEDLEIFIKASDFDSEMFFAENGKYPETRDNLKKLYYSLLNVKDELSKGEQDV